MVEFRISSNTKNTKVHKEHDVVSFVIFSVLCGPIFPKRKPIEEASIQITSTMSFACHHSCFLTATSRTRHNTHITNRAGGLIAVGRLKNLKINFSLYLKNNHRFFLVNLYTAV